MEGLHWLNGPQSHFRYMLQEESTFSNLPCQWDGISYTLVQTHQPSLPSGGNSRILPYWRVPINLIVTWNSHSLDEEPHLRLQMEILFATLVTLWHSITVISFTTLEAFSSWLPFIFFSVVSKNVPIVLSNKLEHCFLAGILAWFCSVVIPHGMSTV